MNGTKARPLDDNLILVLKYIHLLPNQTKHPSLSLWSSIWTNHIRSVRLPGFSTYSYKEGEAVFKHAHTHILDRLSIWTNVPKQASGSRKSGFMPKDLWLTLEVWTWPGLLGSVITQRQRRWLKFLQIQYFTFICLYQALFWGYIVGLLFQDKSINYPYWC